MTAPAIRAGDEVVGVGHSLLATAIVLSVLLHLVVLGLVDVDDDAQGSHPQGQAIAVSLVQAPALSRLSASRPASQRAVNPASSTPAAAARAVAGIASPRSKPVVQRARSPVATAGAAPVAAARIASRAEPVRSRARRLRARSSRTHKRVARNPTPPSPPVPSVEPARRAGSGQGDAGGRASARARDAASGSPAAGKDPAGGAVAAARGRASPRAGISRGPRPAAGNPPPSYPRMARRRGLEGRVLIGLEVAVDGTARDTVVVHSSGVRMLDRAAREAVARWRFEPALNNGRAITAPLRVPVVFRLDRQG